MTPSRINVSAHSSAQCMLECVEHVYGVDLETIFASVEATFPGSSCVTSTRTLHATFLVDDDLVPIKIDKVPGI